MAWALIDTLSSIPCNAKSFAKTRTEKIRRNGERTLNRTRVLGEEKGSEIKSELPDTPCTRINKGSANMRNRSFFSPMRTPTPALRT